MSPDAFPATGPRTACRFPAVAVATALTLAAGLEAAAPSVGCGVQGGVFNTNYQKSQTSPTAASVQDGRREDINGVGGLPAGSTLSSASASADFGSLHLTLLAKATAESVVGNFWGHSGDAHGNAYLSDTFRVDLPGAAPGTVVEVVVAFAVDAAVASEHGDAYLEGTLSLASDTDAGIEIQYQNTGFPAPATGMVVNRQGDAPKITYGEEYAVARIRTGTTYALNAIIQGSAAASADINPGLDPSARVPFSQGAVDAANTAHIGLTPLAAGAKVVAGSGSAYAYKESGPTLVGSSRVDGDFTPVAGAVVDLVAGEITVPLGSESQFFRLEGRLLRQVRGVESRGGQLHVRY